MICEVCKKEDAVSVERNKRYICGNCKLKQLKSNPQNRTQLKMAANQSVKARNKKINLSTEPWLR